MLSRLIPTEKTDPELAPYRSGLIFGFFNALAWQIGIGTPMVLFSEQLGATPFQVGLAYSFIFLLTPLQIFATALLPRFGYKRVMLGGWAARSVFLLVPVWLAIVTPRWGVQPWMAPALVGSVFWFCFFRTIGASAIMPWLYAILPPKARGRYFGSDQFISGIAGVGTLLVCVALFATLPIYLALLVQYLIALSGSYFSFAALKRLPEAENPPPVKIRELVRETPRLMFRRSPFRHYLWLAVWYAVVSTPIPPFLAYYLKVGPQLGADQIMGFEVARYAGVIFAAAFIRRRIDLSGTRPFFLLTMVLYVAVGVFWWWYLRQEAGATWMLFIAYFVLGVAAACWIIANLNYLPQVVDEKRRALMVAVMGSVTACCGGLSPILWGLVLKDETSTGAALNVDVFQLFFLFLIASVVVLSSLLAKLPEENAGEVHSLVIGNAIFRPFRAATYLVSLIDLQAVARPTSKPPDETSSRKT